MAMLTVTDVFGEAYARIYDILYKDKDYDAECEALVQIASARGLRKGDSILDVGCGTGTHAAILAAQGFHVVGVDRSPSMLNLARAKHGALVEFHDPSWLSDNRNRFHLAYSLFDVLSYQSTVQSALDFVGQLSSAVTPDGVVILDAWHSPALTAEPPIPREVTIQIEGEGSLTRRVTPKFDCLTGVTTLTYEIASKDGAFSGSVIETHEMKSFNVWELSLLAAYGGLEKVHFFPSLQPKASIKAKDWHIALVASRPT